MNADRGRFTQINKEEKICENHLRQSALRSICGYLRSYFRRYRRGRARRWPAMKIARWLRFRKDRQANMGRVGNERQTSNVKRQVMTHDV